jgi:hypothetical protein
MRLSSKLFTVLALALAVGLGLAASPFASSSPDGLEMVAQQKGFLDDGRLHSLQYESPIPDYAFPGVENDRLATALAGFVGTLGVAGAAFLVARPLRRRSPGAA